MQANLSAIELQGSEHKPGPNCMQVVYSSDRSFVAASHEDPVNPGALKKILFRRADLQAGTLQMINWARMPPGKSFARHYHEDMQEIFLIVSGKARLEIDEETVTLRRGDAVVIDPAEIHQMWNDCDEDIEYVVLGITGDRGGQTVVVGESD